jgi:hypothetical protein
MTATQSKGKSSPKVPPSATGGRKTEKVIIDAAKAALESQETETIIPKPAKPSAMDFAVQQLSTPVAKTPESTAEFKAKLEALQQEYGVKIAVSKTKISREKIVQNGVTRPGKETICGQVFEVADKITTEQSHTATIAEVKSALPKLNDHTVKTQYARWRQFNGIVGRLSVKQEVGSGVVAEPGQYEV